MAFSLLFKCVFISIGVLSVALALKNAVPLVVDFSTTQAPAIWSAFCSWLKPPYLYVIINGIIISIAASSRFYNTSQNQRSPQDEEKEEELVRVHDDREMPLHHQPYVYEELNEMMKKSQNDVRTEEIRFGNLEPTVEAMSVLVVEEENNNDNYNNGSVVAEDGDESTWTPAIMTEATEIMLPPVEKPLVSARFYHRKPVKASPEGGRALGVSKPKRHETLENTWKMITDGRSMPLNRHLKKSDTFAENVNRYNGRQREINDDNSYHQVKKSETFKDRTNYQLPPVTTTPSPLKLRKEPSLSQDELNRRVEAFIKKFNEEMRLQRQESLNQYKEMINR